ncbi:MAG: universal stress protein [Azonexus sp.]|nr:universal stress protein [Azonexus sp.]
MQTVLLAVDQSASAFEATLYVVKFIKKHGPLVVHVAHVQSAPLPWQTQDKIQEAIEAHISLESHTALLHDEQVSFKVHVRQGAAGETLVAIAEELGCDHIIMGSRGLGGLSGIALGSVTQKILHLANVPVTCVPGHTLR